MERWQNKVAVVTGASSGIGAACCKYLVKNKLIVVGLARRKDRIVALRSELENEEEKQRLHAIKCDVRNEDEVRAAFMKIEIVHGPIAVLVNNAGILRDFDLVEENNSENVRAIIETNILGVVFCTREAFRSMKSSAIDGHVILINSITGHHVFLVPGKSFNIYPSTKFAITAMTEAYRQEFMNHNTKIKITSISPGVTDTELFSEGTRAAFASLPFLKPDDIAEAMIYCLQTPPHVQVHELTIKPVGEPLN